MGLSNIQLEQTSDSSVNQLQQNIKTALAPLVNNPLLGGSIVGPQALVAGNNNISHGLNRTWQGWIVVDRSGAASIYSNQGSVNSSQILVLNSSAAVTVTLYVF